ncbi:MAG TPA: PAN domain-containing protein, partial [Methylocella sp.]|nr:PAN domain-containing protein [Methylocella sp.]
TPGATQIVASQGGLAFNQGLEVNRPGLLLLNGAIILGFSALNCDNAGWHGWIMAYRESDLAQVGVFVTTGASGYGGGVWGGGTGIAADGSGNIYFATGNGSVSATDLSESFVKLKLGPAPSYGLSLAGSYTVTNWAALNAGDADLGSSGPVLLPGNRLVGGGKQGKLYVLNSATMLPTQNGPAAGPVPANGSDGFQAFINTWHYDSTMRTCMYGVNNTYQCYMPPSRYQEWETAGPNIHTGPIYWNGMLYAMPEKDYVRAFPYNGTSGTLATSPALVSTVRAPDGMTGGALSLSANGSTNGIIWAIVPKSDGQWANVPAAMYAFDATNLQELWTDTDDIGFATFDPPTIAGGKVFRPTFANMLMVYGLVAGGTTIPCYNIPQLYQNYSGANGALGSAIDSVTTLPDGLGQKQDFANGTIHWTAQSCAHEVHGAIASEWYATGLTQGPLGYPVINQTVTPDSIGRYNHFSKGASIYWTPTTGAHEVDGPIRTQWAALGWEQSALGYPVTDEADQINGNGRFSLFQHGSILWNATTSAVTVNADPATLLGPQEPGNDRPGSDFSNFDLPEANPAICEQQCSSQSSCKAWTYVAPNTTQGPNPRCWLKNAIPLAVARSCCTSGLKVAIHPSGFSPIEGAFDRPGGDFANFNVPNGDPLLCQGECAGNSQCVAWAFVGDTSQCWLKSSSPPLVPNVNVTTGSLGN